MLPRVCLLLIALSLTACEFIPASDDSGDDELQKQLEAALTGTAAVEQAVAEALTSEAEKQAAAITDTPVPPTATLSPTETPTLPPTETPADTPTETIPPTPENPWIMQAWCLDHVGCVKTNVENKTNDWAQITLTYIETDETKFFTVRPNGRAQITLRPGMYKYVFNFCGGEKYFEGTHTLNNNWKIVAKCKY
jgi:hypothetical protein